MAKLKIALLCVFLQSALQAQVYLTVTSSSVKKAKLAVGQVHPTQQMDPQWLKKVRDQVLMDLEFTNLFDNIPEGSFAALDTPRAYNDVRYDDWSKVQVSFLLKMGLGLYNEKLTLEAFFYDIPGKKKLLANKYQYTTTNIPRLVHAMTEDILKVVTGERGLFFSRILMSCRDLKIRKNPPKEIYVADVDGRNFQPLTMDKTLSLSPSWSPDGKNISYTQFEFVGSGKIRRKKGTVLKMHDLTNGKRKVLSAKEGMNSGASWSSDGKRIALTLSYSGRPEIYFMDPWSGEDPQPASRNIKWQKAGGGFQDSSVNLLFDVEPSFSPDGKKMVISSARSGHPMIYTVDLTTMIAKQLTFAGTYNASPAWSPKGDVIMFAAQRLAEGNFDLYRIDTDGNNLQRVTLGEVVGRRRANNENPSWAPTGRHIAFASNESGDYAVYVMTADGAIKRRVNPPDKECFTPSWGPPEG